MVRARAFLERIQNRSENDANKDAVMAHLAAGNPQESEDPAFASALFDVVRSKTVPIEESHGLGFMPPEVWEEWQAAQVAGGEMAAPLDDLSAAFTNDFVLKLQAEMK